MIIPGTVVAVLSWNAALKRLGAQNAILFSNLIPITTFAIQIARGYQFSGIEMAGAALAIGALVANNLVQRRSSALARASAGTARVIGTSSERRRGDSAILRLSQPDSSS